MGRRIAECACDDERIHRIIEMPRDVDVDTLRAHLNGREMSTALIDFTSDHGAHQAMIAAHALKIAVVVGTTGLSDDTRATAQRIAADIPVIVAPNTSLGVALLRSLVHRAGTALVGRCDLDVLDVHHATKKDSPSGTARNLCAILRKLGFSSLSDADVHVTRAGTIVGEHAVQFTLAGERLTLRHECHDRDVFARGALDAACWLVGRDPGLYAMDDVLGLRSAPAVTAPPR